jgi:hypothetical protein
MIRKITSDFKFIDKDRIEVKIVDSWGEEVNTTISQYDLSSFNDIRVYFYNQLIDDFDAEFDDDLATTIDKIIEIIIREYEMEEK